MEEFRSFRDRAQYDDNWRNGIDNIVLKTGTDLVDKTDNFYSK